jgi:hypothetical protein
MENYPKILIPEGIQDALKYQPSINDFKNILDPKLNDGLSPISPFISSLYRYHVHNSERDYENIFGKKPAWNNIQGYISTPYPPYYQSPSPPLEQSKPSEPKSLHKNTAQYSSSVYAPVKPTKLKQTFFQIKPPVHEYSKYDTFKILSFKSEFFIYIAFFIFFICILLILGNTESIAIELIEKIGEIFIFSVFLYVPIRMILINYFLKIIANINFKRDKNKYHKEILKVELKAEIEYERKLKEYEVKMKEYEAKMKEYEESNKHVYEGIRKHEEEMKKFEEKVKEYYDNKKTEQEYINDHFNKHPDQKGAYEKYKNACDENKRISDEIETKKKYLHEKIQYHIDQLYDKGYGYKEIRLPRIINALETTEKFEYHNAAVLKGKSEESFKKLLQSFFGGHIVSDVTLNNIYFPDILYYDSQFNLMIDIEIDEPYEMDGKRPIHLIGDDTERDNYFLSKNWIVVRFSEKQITLCPNACVKLLSELIKLLTYESIFGKIFYQLELPQEEIIIENHWTFEEANYMGIKNARNHYDATNSMKIETQNLLRNIRGKEHDYETNSYVDQIKTELYSLEENVQKYTESLMEHLHDSFSLWQNYLNICAGGNGNYIAFMSAGVRGQTSIIRGLNHSKLHEELSKRKHVILHAKFIQSGSSEDGFTWSIIKVEVSDGKSILGAISMLCDQWPRTRLQSVGNTFRLLPCELEVIYSDEKSVILRNLH